MNRSERVISEISFGWILRPPQMTTCPTELGQKKSVPVFMHPRETLRISIIPDAEESKYPPAKPGALCCEPLKAAIGVAGAPPMRGPPEGGSWIPDAPWFWFASELRVQFRPRYLGTNAA